MHVTTEQGILKSAEQNVLSYFVIYTKWGMKLYIQRIHLTMETIL